MIKRIKNYLRRRQLARAGFAVELPCPAATYGTEGGSWVACPDAIRADSTVYSFGIGRDLSFDLAVAARHRATVHAFDPTPACTEWIRSQTLPPGIVFHELGLAAHDGHIEFRAPRKTSSSHYTPIARYRTDDAPTFKAPVAKLSTILRQLGHTRIDLLKMDIEGGEYDALADLLREKIPVHQLLVEFHHNYETIPLQRTLDALAALRAAHFRIFAISDRSYEISLLNEAWRDDR